MKRIFLIVLLVTIESVTIAQIGNDPNYRLVFSDHFDAFQRGWAQFEDTPNGLWRAYLEEWPSGVTRDSTEHQVYRTEQCVFDPEESCIRLVSEYAGHRIECGEYEVPGWGGCDRLHNSLYYYSGNIETIEKFRYGYFEIRCKLPIHAGAFPAFWLWGQNSARTNYEEIDIFEYSKSLLDFNLNPERMITLGIYYHPTSPNWGSYGRQNLEIGSGSLSDWNVFGCEWLPNCVKWFCNGEQIAEYSVRENIPQSALTLKVNYAIDKYALTRSGIPNWCSSDEMVIDYVKVYQLQSDCSVDRNIVCTEDFHNIDYKVYRNIHIAPSSSDPILFESNLDEVLRASNQIVIDGQFEVQQGSTLTLFVHDCTEN